MTDETTETVKLGTYRGRKVLGVKVDIRNTGSGYVSAALDIDPRIIEVGEEVDVVLRATCIAHDHDVEDRKEPEKGGVYLVLVLNTTEAALIDESITEPTLKAQRELIQAHKDDAKGNSTVASQLAALHEEGAHPEGEYTEGCPLCDQERNRAEWEGAPALADGGDPGGLGHVKPDEPALD